MIHHGDCLDILRTLPDCSADAVVTDPPYCSGGFTETQRRGAKGQGLRSVTLRRDGWFDGDVMGTAGLCELLRSVAVQTKRLIRPGGSLLVFCDWRMLVSLQPAIESAGVRLQNLVVWDKGSMGLGQGFRPQHELIMHFTFGGFKGHDNATSNVLKCSRTHASKREHPTEKPVELLRRLVVAATPPGGTVLDPFAGSGTTGVACVLEGRQFIGVEQCAEYVEMAQNRIKAATQQKEATSEP